MSLYSKPYIMPILITIIMMAILVFCYFAPISGFGSGERNQARSTDCPSGREALYWQAPMDPAFRSSKPGKSPMGMDLIPICDDPVNGRDRTSIQIDPRMVQNLGIRTARVKEGPMARAISAVGMLTYDESTIISIDVRSEGWVEDLKANETGQPIAKGDLLFRLYSRPLIASQADYLQALKAGHPFLSEAAKERLLSLGMTKAQIDRLRLEGKVMPHIDILAPRAGVLLSLDISEGAFIKPGITAMRIAGLERVWARMAVHESRINWVQKGQQASMTLPSQPGEPLTAVVDYVYPAIDPKSRTGQVRLVLQNPDQALMPGMYASFEIMADPLPNRLSIPSMALIRTGDMERVIVALGEGRFRPAEVRSGILSGDEIEILEGLAPGDRVVTSGQFLLDSEASIRGGLLRLLSHEDQGASRHD
ncbi:MULTISPECIES: efflux RND transporter periplasmic adaptor subunit [unclassified Iodidimonas]|jgi:Cu(I)/Ag(I) efflux system membrane fusion protein|uniref:efflux RND transporter periplasmic adaptor subunit n=1 Tax=unclassified Iodidimonas TaxID=2626145 RepID=UPI00248304C4|nr:MULTISPECIES: efflux RND transporter periplasmic adaptor subunit [unclassified Iodidimonas]